MPRPRLKHHCMPANDATHRRPPTAHSRPALRPNAPPTSANAKGAWSHQVVGWTLVSAQAAHLPSQIHNAPPENDRDSISNHPQSASQHLNPQNNVGTAQQTTANGQRFDLKSTSVHGSPSTQCNAQCSIHTVNTAKTKAHRTNSKASNAGSAARDDRLAPHSLHFLGTVNTMGTCHFYLSPPQ